MPSFGKTSLKHLKTLHLDLQYILNEAIKTLDFYLISGHRGEEEQNKAYDEGNSKLRFPDSPHNKWPSLGGDVAPCLKNLPHLDWNAELDFAFLMGYLQRIADEKGIEVRLGCKWSKDCIRDNKFRDLGHIELIPKNHFGRRDYL
ncbi:M15 family peptidase [Candidatus Pacearchaeota archaeon]|nr:M15 family peptidase [Candidatus Pacearchaeota archaeon]